MTHYIIGSGGHGRVIADILVAAGGDEPVFIGQADLVTRYQKGDVVLIGIGDNFSRGRVAKALLDQNPEMVFGTAIHPAAVISRSAVVAPGTVAMAGAIVNTGVKIGAHVILNTTCSVDHDCLLGEFASVAPGAALGGNVNVGAYTAISIGAAVAHGCAIGEHTVVGAGAVVVKSLPGYAVCYGVPAKKIRERSAGDKYL